DGPSLRETALAGAGHQPKHRGPGVYRTGAGGAARQPARPRHLRGAAAQRPHPRRTRPAPDRATRPLADRGRPPRLCGGRGARPGDPAHPAVPVECQRGRMKGGQTVMDDAIRTYRLTKRYGGRKVVDNLDLRVPRGTVYGLLGRNGAGKSTTLKMITGMVRPDHGRVELLGADVDTLSTAARARIAYLAEGHPLYTGMTVREAVAFTTSFYPAADRVLVDQVLDHFALSPKARIGRLSKGQRAQVSLALAIAPDPELLILD